MAGAKIIKQILLERGISLKDFAEMYQINYQSMRNKIHRDAFTFEEMIKVADLLNCDIEVITRDTKQSFKY
jgi:lambda repressor-like predicted transcriptional regulator